jgi:DNA-binding transcriptional LysR family regulator
MWWSATVAVLSVAMLSSFRSLSRDASPRARHPQARLVVQQQALLVAARGVDVDCEGVSFDPGFELRHLRTFAAVADRRSFSRAADDLHIAQQAVSQQIKSLERSLGVSLLRRSPRRVELTPEGRVFLADCRRVLAAADRAGRRVRAAARGEAGTLRLVYTLTTVWDTLPRLMARVEERYAHVSVQAREVFGADIADLLLGGRYDVALAPRASYPKGFHARAVRREPLRLALSAADPLARRRRLELAPLAERLFELWPREMAPGFYDAVVGTCRAAGFEPTLDEHAAGNTVWGNIAKGRGVALINASLADQLPRGIALVELAGPTATLTFDAVWHGEQLPLVGRALAIASELGDERGWLCRSARA